MGTGAKLALAAVVAVAVGIAGCLTRTAMAQTVPPQSCIPRIYPDGGDAITCGAVTLYAGGNGGGGWQTAFDCSFQTTDGGTTAFFGNGDSYLDAGALPDGGYVDGGQTSYSNLYTICGQSWAKLNGAQEASATTLSPVGLNMSPVSGSNYTSGGVTSPLIRLFLTNIIPGLSASTAVRVWAYSSGLTASSDYNFQFNGLEADPTPSTLTRTASAWGHSLVPVFVLASVVFGSTDSSINSPNSPPWTSSIAAYNVELLTKPLGVSNTNAMMEIGNYSAGWPAASTLTRFGDWAAIGTQLYPSSSPAITVSPGAFDVTLACQGGGAAGAECSWGRVRVDYR